MGSHHPASAADRYRPTAKYSLTITMSMNSGDISVPDWVVSLAEDHFESLRLLFRAAACQRAQLDAIAVHKVHGSFPGNLGMCLDISVMRSMPTSATALDTAERCAMRENERILDRISNSQVTMVDSMRETLEMMCAAMKRTCGREVSAEIIEAWNEWFADKLDVALREEFARRKSRQVRRKRRRPSVLTDLRFALIQPGAADGETSCGSPPKPAP
jgi:BMFP domain-containing protein YqiC